MPPSFEPRAKRPLADLLGEASELLEESVASRLIADVPLGVFLSGGVDSTLAASLAARHTADRLKTFTVDYDTESVGERTTARRAAAAVGAEYHELILSTQAVRDSFPTMFAELDQPLADPAYPALRALCAFARREVTVAVGGKVRTSCSVVIPVTADSRVAPHSLGGSRAGCRLRCCGAPGAPRAPRLSQLGEVLAPTPTFARHVDWVTSRRRSLRNRLYGPRLREVLNQVEPLAAPRDVDLESGDLIGSLMRLSQLQWLPDDVLAKGDRASMSVSCSSSAACCGR